VTPVEVGLAVVVVGAGSVLQGSVGFGLGLVSVPLLILIEPRLIPGPMLFNGIALTLLLSHRERRSIDFGGVGWALVGRFPGTALGAAALLVLPRHELDLAFAVLVLLAVAVTSLPIRVPPNRAGLIGAGALSGFMATTVAIGGPPIALLLQHAAGPRLRGTLSGFFLVGATVSLLTLAAIGRFGRTELVLALVPLPGIIIGFLISARIAKRLDHAHTRQAVLAVAAVTGVVAMVKALM
jgi:uncharacterized membrane protein YfcA